MNIQFNIIRSLITHPIDYTVPQALFLIEQYILYRKGKVVRLLVDKNTNIELFEKAVTTADNYFRLTYGKLWH
jgi:hypothetical protein